MGRKEQDIHTHMNELIEETTAMPVYDAKNDWYCTPLAPKVRTSGSRVMPQEMIEARDKIRHHTRLHGPGHRKCSKCKRMVMRNSLFCYWHAHPQARSLRKLVGTQKRRSRPAELLKRVKQAARWGKLPNDLVQNKTFQNVIAHASAKANRGTTLKQAKASGVSGMAYARMARAAVDRKHACSMLSASMVTAFLDWQDTGDATGWAEAIADARRLGANEPLRDP